MAYMKILHTLIFCFVTAILASADAGRDISDIDAQVCPGRVLILAEEGHRPSLEAVLSGVPFDRAKAYAGWRLEPFSERMSLKVRTDKAAFKNPLDDLYFLSFPDSVDVMEVLSELQGCPGLKYVEPDFRLELYEWPQDSLFEQQWYLHNTGQEFYAVERLPGAMNDVLYLETGTPGEDINMSPLYESPPADAARVLVAIIDTGIDYVHPDLESVIYYNPGEIPDNGLDDDHNGLVDDYRGWDFSGDTTVVINLVGDNDATDSIGHGTHVTGLVAAKLNGIGIAGYAGDIKILPIKIFPNGFQSVSIAGILYAADMGAQIINISWGFPFNSNILREALQYAESRGCLAVAAAGNFGNSWPTYPASFEETFTVGGSNADGFVTYFSTYGPFLDIVAPGLHILSLRAAGTDLYAPEEEGLRIIADKYILADGTSMSAPIVTGAAAMLWSYNPGLDAATIKDILRQSADDLIDPFDEGEYLPGFDTLSGWGRLNVGRAFEMAQAPAGYISSPQDAQLVSETVVIGAGTTGGFSGPADLYLGAGKSPETWTPLYHTETLQPADSFFLWDSDGLSGYYAFRLDTENGSSRVDVRLVNGIMAELASPADGDTLKYLVGLSGSAFAADYDSMQITYRREEDPVRRVMYKSTDLFFDEFMYEWAIFSIDSGRYVITLDAFADGKILSDSVTVDIRSAMRHGFPIHHPAYMAFSPGVADIDGDGRKEIVAGTKQGLYAYNDDGSPLTGFPVLTDLNMQNIPAFDDIDGDGLKDIIVTGENVLACFNYLGQPLGGWPRDASTGLTFVSHPVAVPTQLFDRDDSVLIYISKYGEVRAYRYNGDSYFYSLDGLFTALDPNIFDTAAFAGLTLPYISAADLDGNGTTEVISVYGTSDSPSGIYIWNGRNGLAPFDWDSPLARKISLSHGGILADMDEDGTLEIIMVGQDTTGLVGIWVTKNGREDLPGWPVILVDAEEWIGTAPVCADIDGDGGKEILVAYYNYDVARVYAFRRDGTPYLEVPGQPSGVMLTTSVTLSNIILADINGDGSPNIVSRGGYLFPGTGYERVFAWDLNGDPVPGFPITTPTPMNEVVSLPYTPIVDDLDGDGTVELIMTGDNRDLFVWNLDRPYNADQMLWPKFLGDEKNSGINPNRGMPTPADENDAIVPDRFGIVGNYPNPFNPETAIEFTLDRSAEIRLEIFNILGQRVATPVSGTLPAGSHRCVWTGTDGRGDEVASGVYFARLSGAGQTSTRKMTLIR